ncbi:low temperature requirement protein A [Plantactinospora sonchi]|uniref:Low temperature requirement protein A n=1 Tax=Plantactinospora sonchi TaxID=1544735 RepID=A0ABU7RM03_9ACTN
MAGQRPGRLLRRREHPQEPSFLELFFDLAFVISFTMLSARLVHDLDWLNGVHTAALFVAIWWLWVTTAWSTDWFNPHEPLIRGLVLAVMFAVLLMTGAVPEAFDEHGVLFAGTYAAVHLGRAALLIPLLRGHPAQRRTMVVAVWFGVSAVPLMIGAFLPDEARLALWLTAIALDYGVAVLGWPLPLLGRLESEHLQVVGVHLAERYQQIFIVALGEIFLVTGMAYAQQGLDMLRTVALAMAFLNAGLLLWIYFVPSANRLGPALERNRPRVVVYAAYCHAVMVGAVVLTAVGAEVTLDHPLGEVNAAWSVAIVGGAALYLGGRVLLGALVYELFPWRSLTGMVVLLAALPGFVRLPPLAVLTAVNVVLLVVIVAYHYGVVRPAANVDSADARRRPEPERP